MAPAPRPAFSIRWRLRDARAQDEAFLRRLHDAVRAPELLLAPWSAEQKDAFLADQYRLQQAHYRQTRPNADYWVIEQKTPPRAIRPIGRMSLDRTEPEWRLMEIALLPERRNRGLGSELIGWVQQAAHHAGAEAVTLHVVTSNRSAHRLYVRLGFVEVPSPLETHHMLRWTPHA